MVVASLLIHASIFPSSQSVLLLDDKRAFAGGGPSIQFRLGVKRSQFTEKTPMY